MRKSFTQLFSIFILICAFGLTSTAAGTIAVDYALSPEDNASDVMPTVTQFVITFTDDVRVSAAGGTFSIYENESLIATIPVNSGSTDAYVEGKNFIVEHGLGDLTEGEDYSLALTSGALEYNDGTEWLSFGAISGTAWDFTIGDYTAPKLASENPFSPVSGAEHVDATAEAFALTLKLNEVVEKGTGNFYIYNAAGTIIDLIPVADVSILDATVTIPVDDDALFKELSSYYVLADAGVLVDMAREVNVEEGTGPNKFAGISDPATWTFTTRDYSAPVFSEATVTTITKTGATFSVTMNEPATVNYYILEEPATLTTGTIDVTAAGVATTKAITGLTANTDYTVTFTATNKEETAPNTTAEGDEVVVEFSTVDDIAPTAKSEDLDVNDAKETVGLVLTFEEEVEVAGSSVIEVKKQSNNEIVRSVAAASVVITDNATDEAEATEWYATIPFEKLDSKGEYYVILPAGLIQDIAENPFAGYTTTTAWAFEASDYEKPIAKVDASNFADGKVGAAAADVYLNFDETVSLVSGSDWSTAVAFELDNVTVPAAISYSTPNIIINPTDALAANTTYTLKLRPNAVEDGNGNVPDAATFNVITGDFGGATVTVAVEETEGLANENVKPTITFSKYAETISTEAAAVAADIKDAITFENSSSEEVDFTVAYDAATYVATITPATLASNETYTISIDETLFEDASGVDFSGVTNSVVFTVRDYEKPEVTLSHDGEVITGTPLTITITDDNDVTLLNGDAVATENVESLITLKKGGMSGANVPFTASLSGDVITITATLDLDETYYYGIGASLKDDQGNVIDASYNTFTLITDPGAPTANVTAYSPAIDAIHVDVTGGNLVATLTFDKQLRVGTATGIDAIAELYDGVVSVSTYQIVANSINGNVLTLTFAGVTLTSNGVYYITVPASVVEGNSTVMYEGNAMYPDFEGIAANEWSFTAEDSESPTVTGTPTGTGVALDADFTLTFNEKVVLGTGNILINDGESDVTIAVGSGLELAENGMSATIAHSDLVKYETEYTVTVPATAVKDTSGNEMAAAYSWSFTTDVNVVPTVEKLVPANDADLVSTTTAFEITFSEPMTKGDNGNTIYLVKSGSTGTRASLNTDGTLNTANDQLIASLLVESNAVSITDKVATINFGVTLVADAEYFILVEPGTFIDQSEGVNTPAAFEALDTYGQWVFNTGDVNAPTYEVTYTERGENMMAFDSDITITFSKPIEKTDGSAISNVDIANLFDVDVDSNPAEFTGTIDATKTIVVITNSSITDYPITKESSEVTIASSGSIRGAVSDAAISVDATIIVSDYAAPELMLSTVTPAAEGDAADFTLTSSEAGTIYYTYMAGDGDTEAPAVDVIKGATALTVEAATAKDVNLDGLTSETSYVVFAVAEDALGNTTEVSSEVFVTPDVTKPTLADGFTLPTEFTMTSATAGTLTLEFSEDVNANSAVVKLYNKATGVYVGEAALALVTDETDQLVAAFTGLPEDVVTFYAEIEGGVIEDDAALTFDGIYRPTWEVSTTDQTPPTLVDNTDFGEAQAVDASFTFTFDEDVKLASPLPASAFLIKYETEPYEVVVPANISIDGAVVTVNPSRDFLASKSTTDVESYTLEIKQSAIVDMAGNPWGALTSTFEIETADTTPAVAVFTPDGSADVDASTEVLTIVFDEDLYMLDGTALDDFDVDSLVTFVSADEAIDFDASVVVGGGTTTITIGNFVDLTKHKGEAFVFGFKAAFQDLAENVVPAETKTFLVATEPIVNPDIVFSPNNDDSENPTEIPVDQVFTIGFNGQVYTSSAVVAENNIAITPAYLEDVAITLIDGESAPIAFTAEVTTWTADTTVITITPDEVLESETDYTLAVVGGTLQLGTGNANILSGADNNYTAMDVVPPVLDVDADGEMWLDGYYPGSGETIAKTDSLQLAFDEPVKAGTGTITIYRWDGVVAKQIDASTLKTTNDGKTVINVAYISDLPTNVEYYVIVPKGAITDLAGNEFAGIAAVDEWKFYVQDDNIPHYASLAPMGTNIAVDADLTIEFDRDVELGDTGYIAIYKADGTAVQLILASDMDSFTATDEVTIDIAELAAETDYMVEVGEGTFTSTTGVDFEGITTSEWMFSTESNTAPELVENGLTPEDEATGVLVSQSLVMEFDMAVAAGAGTIDIHAADGTILKQIDVMDAAVVIDSATVTVDVSDILEISTAYYVIVTPGFVTNGSVTPEAFVGLVQPTDWNFTTADDGIAPEAILSPMETGLTAADVVLTMDFSENVVLGAGMVTIYDAVADTVVEMIDITDATLTDDTLVTITPSMIVEDMSYYVMVDAGVVTDVTGNPYAGVADNTTWTFATSDVTVPTVDMLSPDDETIEDNHPTFEMVMSEDVQLTEAGGSIHVIPADGDGTAILDIALTAEMITDNVITIEYVYDETIGGLAVNAAYYVTVDADAIEDMSGNAFAGISDPAEWTFTTGADLATGVVDPVSDSLEFKVYPNPFSEYVKVENADKLSRIIISNVAGQRVKDIVSPTETIQTSDLRSGIYFMTLITKDDVVAKTERIVKR